jgi:monovalent cation/hydrogen antiporter
MHLAYELVALVAVATAVAVGARRFGLSEPLALTVTGVAASYLPFIPHIELTSELVLVGLLPPLLYTTSIRTSLLDFKANRRPILLLSVGLVLFTTFGVAVVAWWLLPLPFAVAVALGAVVAPPDAVAATSVARRTGMPRRLVSVLEGESLVNDATALVTLRTAIAATAGTVSIIGVVADFALATVGGIIVGIVAARLLGRLRRHITDPVLDTTVSFLAPFLTYLPAEAIHASGVLAVVVAGMILGHHAPVWQSASSRIAERTNWRTVQSVLENSVFLLIGLQGQEIVQDAWRAGLGHARVIGACAAILAAAMLLRAIWVFPATYLPRRIRSVREKDPSPPWQHAAVVAWAGMRGAVTLAAVFVLPEDTPYRPVLVLVALVVVMGTLLLQGTTLPWLVRRLRLRGPTHAEDALQEADLLQRAAAAGLRLLDEDLGQTVPPEIVEVLRRRVVMRSNTEWERLGPSESERLTPSASYRRLRLAMLGAERQEVLRARDSGVLSHEVLEAVMGTLDLEESQIDRFTQAEDELHGEELIALTGGGQCRHLAAAPLSAQPDTPGVCHECLDEDLTWVHLRMCLACGHVACCDSSTGRHAERHYDTTHHPVMRSAEPGEAWRWCYIDAQLG